VIYATIASQSSRVYTTILTPAEVASGSPQASSAPTFASLADRFDLTRGASAAKRTQTLYAWQANQRSCWRLLRLC